MGNVGNSLMKAITTSDNETLDVGEALLEPSSINDLLEVVRFIDAALGYRKCGIGREFNRVVNFNQNGSFINLHNDRFGHCYTSAVNSELLRKDFPKNQDLSSM